MRVLGGIQAWTRSSYLAGSKGIIYGNSCEFLVDAAGPGIQFCAIFPLDEDQYGDSSRDISENNDLFRPTEALLNIPDLLHSIKKSAKRWCSCRRPYNEYSPDMALCNNMKCEIGWYHLECVPMDEVPDFWLCRKCQATDPATHIYSKDSDVDYDEELYTERSDRVQLTKAIARVWAKHDWPRRDKLLNKMEKFLAGSFLTAESSTGSQKVEIFRSELHWDAGPSQKNHQRNLGW